MIINTWKEVMKDKTELQYGRKLPLFKYDYWILTRKIETDLEIGKIRQSDTNMNDKDLVKKFLLTYDLGENTRIFYIDGSKTEKGMSTGVGIVI